ILIADKPDRAEDLEATQSGAADYLVRDRLDATLLERSIRYAVEASRRGAGRAVREADRRKDAFFATLAHELRNPLAPLSSATEILSRAGDRPEEGERRERALDLIEREVAKMARLID